MSKHIITGEHINSLSQTREALSVWAERVEEAGEARFVRTQAVEQMRRASNRITGVIVAAEPAKSFPDWQPGEGFEGMPPDQEYLVFIKDDTNGNAYDVITPSHVAFYGVEVIRFHEIPEGENRD